MFVIEPQNAIRRGDILLALTGCQAEGCRLKAGGKKSDSFCDCRPGLVFKRVKVEMTDTVKVTGDGHCALRAQAEPEELYSCLEHPSLEKRDLGRRSNVILSATDLRF